MPTEHHATDHVVAPVRPRVQFRRGAAGDRHQCVSATGIEANINLDSREAQLLNFFDPTDTSPATDTTTKSDGGHDLRQPRAIPHIYSPYFVKTATTNEWEVYATVSNLAGAAVDVTALGLVDTLTLAPMVLSPGLYTDGHHHLRYRSWLHRWCRSAVVPGDFTG